MNREEKLKDLQRQIDELKNEPVLEVGKWYSTSDDGLKFIEALNGYSWNGYGFGTDGVWVDSYTDCSIHYMKTPATNEEVEAALIKEAKKRGFEEGMTSSFKCLRDGREWSNRDFFNTSEDNSNLGLGANYIFLEGKWAEIIENKVTINGYDMKQEGCYVTFGCAKFQKMDFTELMPTVDVFNHHPLKKCNRKIKSITLDSGVEITVKQLKEICDSIK